MRERESSNPASWKQIRAKLRKAYRCADCRELQAFTLDPVEPADRFRVRQDRRQHLHQQIEKHSLDMTHVTDRKGSPQTLVCTKDRRSYQRRCKEFRLDIAALGKLTELAGGPKAGNAVTLKQIAAARALAMEWSPG